MSLMTLFSDTSDVSQVSGVSKQSAFDERYASVFLNRMRLQMNFMLQHMWLAGRICHMGEQASISWCTALFFWMIGWPVFIYFSV